MPAKEIKELRQSGRLEEALTLAESEYNESPDNIWTKRNLSWVYYDYLKKNTEAENFEAFISWLDKIKNLNLPEDEKMLFEQLCWQVGKMAIALQKINPPAIQMAVKLFQKVEPLKFPAQTEGYSFLLKGFQKTLKESDSYLSFIEWWGLDNLRTEDFVKDKLPNGREVMSIAEQAYITKAKFLLPRRDYLGNETFDKEKAIVFLPKIEELASSHPSMQYPSYFHAKLLFATGEKEDALRNFLPFARKKKNDFWVWDFLADVFMDDQDMVFSFYCRALICKSPEEMLTKLRQKMARILIQKQLYAKAKTEIEKIIKVKNENNQNISTEILNWQNQSWFTSTQAELSNLSFYRENIVRAEEILYQDIPATIIIIDFVNSDKKIANFITSERQRGFFKFERILNKVKIGDILKVRFDGNLGESMNKVFTAEIIENSDMKENFIKEIQGQIKISNGKNFGFVENIYIHPNLVARYRLKDGDQITGRAIYSWNKDKNEFSWKIFEINI